MNKKQLQRIKALYRDGVTPQVCVTSIIEMSNSDFEAATSITKFYNDMVVNPLVEELHTVRLELSQWQEFETRLKKETEGLTYESSDGKKPSNMEDK